jgi:hypothetical protein
MTYNLSLAQQKLIRDMVGAVGNDAHPRCLRGRVPGQVAPYGKSDVAWPATLVDLRTLEGAGLIKLSKIFGGTQALVMLGA